VLKHFTIGLLSELQQQVRYEQTKMFDEVNRGGRKKGGEHGGNSMTNFVIHGESNRILN
jgi:hypothetical protein